MIFSGRATLLMPIIFACLLYLYEKIFKKGADDLGAICIISCSFLLYFFLIYIVDTVLVLI